MDYHFKRCLEKKNLIKFNIDKNLMIISQTSLRKTQSS